MRAAKRLDRVRFGVAVSRLAALCLLALLTPSLGASEPSTAPILRVETGMHTTLIRRLVVDAPRNRLLTCSDDKTIRIWQLPELRLLSTLRVPIDAGHEGQLFALAVSPDGKTVAAGGWTAWDWDGASSIYFFDTANGELVRRHVGLPNAISTLNWTRDGQYLIVGLQGRGGLHMLRLSDLTIVASDTEYLDKIMDVDVRSDGIVAVVALDGMTRLYRKDLKMAGRRSVSGGSKPSAVRFSPDGTVLAVGFIDVPAIALASMRDLSEVHHPDLSGVRDQTGFTSVAWSSDGRYLYAAGDSRGKGRNPVYRWGDSGRAAPETIPLADNRIIEIQQMPDGVIAFASEDPSIGVIGQDTRRGAFRGTDIVDFHDVGNGFAVSADGSVLRYPMKPGNGSLQTFSPMRSGDQNLSRSAELEVFPPLLEAEGIRVENWRDSYAPTINDRRPKLDDYEHVRSYAIAPDRESVLLGTEWGLRLVDRDAREIWAVKLPAVAWTVNLTRNGRLAIAALSDGTVRWYDRAGGTEVLAFFPHNNGRDWICWVPAGYYLSSVYGDNLVGWHLNRGRDLVPDFYLAVQFDRILYRPDVVQAAFRAAMTGTVPSPMPLAGSDFNISRLAEIAPPRLKLQAGEITAAADRPPRLVLLLQGEKTGRDIQDLVVFVNNIPVTPSGERRLSGEDALRFSRRLEIDLNSRENDIRVEAFNGVSMGVAHTFVALSQTTRVVAEPGKLYVLAIGANAFPKLKGKDLKYAVRDAEEMARALRERGRGYFRDVATKVVSDNADTKPERAAIVSTLEFLQQARPEDTVVLFLASHGISDPAGNYYFVPRDTDPADVEAVQRLRKPETMIPWTTFFEALRGIPGRRMLIVDTCYALGIEGRFEAHSLMKRSAASQFVLIVAAKGGEESQEYAFERHGLFTYALISALAAQSDTDHDGLVSVGELFAAAKPIVESHRDKSRGSQTPQLIAPQPLDALPLMRSNTAPGSR